MHIVAAWVLLGLLVGPLLNHLADRLPRHQPLKATPTCASCGHPYRPRQWPALLAYLTRDRKCAGCGGSLPRRRPLLELGLALVYGLLAWRHPLSWGLVAATFHASVLALITVTDLEHRKVPDLATLPAIVVTVVYTGLSCPRCLPGALAGGAIGFLLFLLLTPFHMGFGDVKLAGYVGLIAGLQRVFPCLLFAIIAGGLAAGLGLATGRLARKSYMPYAPYLALAGTLLLLWT